MERAYFLLQLQKYFLILELSTLPTPVLWMIIFWLKHSAILPGGILSVKYAALEKYENS